MRAAIVVFPGSNRERDMAMALRRASGKAPTLVWHGDSSLPDADLIVLPGGFSHGDYLRCGAMAAHSPIMRDVKAKAARGVPVLAVCNGFQIATEAGLLEGALLRNAGLKFVCKDIHLRVETTASRFTGRYANGQVVRVPVAHHDGNYFADAATLRRLADEDRVAFRYCGPDGSTDDGQNPNGSLDNIAGIYNRGKTVLGLMPHPEDATDPLTGGTDGQGLFDSLVASLA
jgi:phosphoribosylformylglycinamidine synthase subunit PurQ / glutaminase